MKDFNLFLVVVILAAVNTFALSDQEKDLYKICLKGDPGQPALLQHCNDLMEQRLKIAALSYSLQSKQLLLEQNELSLQNPKLFLEEYYSWGGRDRAFQNVEQTIEKRELDSELKKIYKEVFIEEIFVQASVDRKALVDFYGNDSEIVQEYDAAQKDLSLWNAFVEKYRYKLFAIYI